MSSGCAARAEISPNSRWYISWALDEQRGKESYYLPGEIFLWALDAQQRQESYYPLGEIFHGGCIAREGILLYSRGDISGALDVQRRQESHKIPGEIFHDLWMSSEGRNLTNFQMSSFVSSGCAVRAGILLSSRVRSFMSLVCKGRLGFLPSFQLRFYLSSGVLTWVWLWPTTRKGWALEIYNDF